MQPKNKYRYRMTSRLGGHVINPLGEADFTIEYNREDETKLDYDKVFPAKILIKGGTAEEMAANLSPYKDLMRLETSIYRCEYILLAIDRSCTESGTEEWVEAFSGRFSFNDADFNLSRCEILITMDDLDPAECYEINKNQQVNILNVFPKRTVKVGQVGVDLEFQDCAITVDFENPGPCTPTYWCGDGDAFDGQWIYYYFQHEIQTPNPGDPPGTTYCSTITKWAREVLLVPCGDPAPGPEWVLVSDTCPGGQRKYARPARTYGCTWTRTGIEPFITYTYSCSVVGMGGANEDLTIDNGVPLEGLVALMMENFCPDITFKSDFFQINPDEVTDINYVTGRRSKTRGITIFQKSDVKRPNDQNNATKGNMTFEQLVEWLCVMFNMRWRIRDGEFRIEHVSWFVRGTGFDLTQPKYEKWVKGLMRYNYETEEVVGTESFSFMEASVGDFQGLPIRYTGPCVTQNGRSSTKNYAADKVTNDVELCLANPAPNSQVSDDGFVFIATDMDGTDFYMITESPILQQQPRLNNTMGWAMLHRDYWKYDRPLAEGNMNGEDVQFLSVRPTKKGVTITIPFCCGDVFNPDDKITTPLGVGIVDSASYSLKDQTLALDLLYQADANLTDNHAPTAVNDTAVCIVDQRVDIDVTANDTDPDAGDYFTRVEIIGLPAHGTVEVLPNLKVRYTPTAGYLGSDLFTYKVYDSWAEPSNTALVSITVKPPNAPPVANPDSYTTNKNTAKVVAAPGVLANDTDDEGTGALTVSAYDATSANGGTIVMATNGGFTYTPPTGFVGTDTFDYTCMDAGGLTDSTTVTMTVLDPALPVANPDTYYTIKNTNLSVAAPGPLVNDTAGSGTLTCVPFTGLAVTGGTATLTAAGAFTFVPTTGFTGTAVIPYTVTNGTNTASSTISVVVIPTVYARLELYGTNEIPVYNPSCPGQVVGGSEASFVRVNFYSNPAGTTPLNVTGLNLTINWQEQAYNFGSPVGAPIPRTYNPAAGTSQNLYGGSSITTYYWEDECFDLGPIRRESLGLTLTAGNYVIL